MHHRQRNETDPDGPHRVVPACGIGRARSRAGFLVATACVAFARMRCSKPAMQARLTQRRPPAPPFEALLLSRVQHRGA